MNINKRSIVTGLIMAICLSLGVVIGITAGNALDIQCLRGDDYLTLQCIN